MKQPKKLPAPEERPLTRFDWSFDDVPNDQLVACCYWEYARESAFIRDVKRRCMDPRCRQMANREAWEYVGNDIERIQSIGCVSNVFLQGMCFNSAEACKPRHKDAPPISGRFPAPWQSLDKAERKYRTPIRINREALRLAPFRRGYFFMTEWIAEHCRRQQQEALHHRQEIQRQNPGVSEIELRAQGKLCSPDIVPSIFPAGSETGVFDIQWASFTNDEIAVCFRKWIQANRPQHLPAPSGRGHKPGDWRAQLARLAVMRLLSHYTPKEILGGVGCMAIRECQPIRESKQFASDKWADATKWHDARREAGELFRKLFPFLPAEEKPLSWERQPPGK